MSKTALITGANGQTGSYLSELLLSKGYEVYGLVRRSSTDTKSRIKHLLGNSSFHVVDGDITDAACMSGLICALKPTEVYNLAAQSDVGISFSQPLLTANVDAIGPINILEAIRQFSPKTKFFQSSTSELMGDTTVAPQNENTPFNPNSPYAVAKLFAHHITQLYRRAYNIFACCSVSYNHESPRRGENFVTRKITKYVAALADYVHTFGELPIPGKQIPFLEMGNLDSKRDWSHAKDMALGMWLMLQQHTPDDYVLGSGVTRSIRELLTTAFGYLLQKYPDKLTSINYADYVRINPNFIRPAEVSLLLSDPSKARRILGWNNTISFDEMIVEMIDADLVGSR